MKKKLINSRLFSSLVLLICSVSSMAQEAGKQITTLKYYNVENKVQYLLLESLLKKPQVVLPQAGKEYTLFMDTVLVAKVKTDAHGKAKAFLPPSLKNAWLANSVHTFSAKLGEEEVVSDYTIKKAKISIDTVNLDGAKSITATVLKLEKDKWIPASGVEMKVGIKRLDGSLLPASDEETLTTDSTGSVSAEFKKEKLPGNEKGMLTLIARVDDNDELGNLSIEKSAAWGVPTKVDNSFFDQRTLWATRFRTPYWLLFLAYSIIIGVWGTLIYLVVQFLKIRKLGAK